MGAQVNKDKKDFSQQVADKERRKLKAEKKSNRSIWHGLGLMGLVGWSVALPVLGGAALGRWLDRHVEAGFSWTLTCITAGLGIGAIIVWNWVSKEDEDMHKDDDERND